VHIAKIAPPPARLPLPQWEIERTHRYRAILDNLIVGSNEDALALQKQMREETAAHEAARHQAAPPQPNPEPAQSPKTAAPTPAPPRQHRPQPVQFNPDRRFKTLVWTIQSCIRLDAWLADRLYRGHTTPEQAGLTHPSRPDILAYLHAAARLANPHEDRMDLHQDLETRVSQELGLFPDRNPADIIAEIATLFDLPFDEADFPNAWRCASFTPPGPEFEGFPPGYELTTEDIEEFIRCQEQERSKAARSRSTRSHHRRE
jgi:hypothetical protein